MENVIEVPELTKEMLGTRDISRQNSKAAGEEIVNIPLDKIVIRDGFNRRSEFGDIEGLGCSILENGQVLPGRVDILAQGKFLLVDGHRRFKALLFLKTLGQEPYFKAIVNNSRTTEEQRIFQMFTTQDNKQLTPNEQANLLQALINLGYKQNEVAKKIGKTATYVSQMLAFATESPVIKNHVADGSINVTTALKLQKEIPIQSERIEAVNKAVNAKKGASKDNKTIPVSVNEVTGKEPEVKSRVERLANKIIETFGNGETFTIDESFKAGLINMIKSYL